MIGASLLMLSAGCRDSTGPQTAQHAREVMGTLAEITAVADDQDTASHAVQTAYQRLDQLEQLMSTYKPNSEISRLNRLSAGQSMKLSSDTFRVLQKSLCVAEQSGGAFDITCRPLLNLWKEAAQNDHLPDKYKLKQTLEHIGSHYLRLNPEDQSVTVMIDGLQVDLGGIAKGYGLDAAAETMQKVGATSGLVNVGGDVLAFGRRSDGRHWTIGIRNAFGPGLMGKLKVTNRAVTTSGIQQRFYNIKGERYSHIIDPRTGLSAEQAPSVTVIADQAIDADAWATVFSVLSVEEGKKLAEKLKYLEVLWVWGDADQLQQAETPGFAQYRFPA
jgi:FAD:protein FMN transferase